MGCIFIATRIFLVVLVLGCFQIPVLEALLYAQGPPVGLQVSSWQTEDSAKRDVDRLKLQGLSAKFSRVTDAQNNIWYVVYIDSFKNKEEALAYGNDLKDKKIINNFRLFNQPVDKTSKTDKKPEAVTRPDPKPSPPREKTPKDSPLKLQEAPDSLRLELLLDRRAIPEVRSEKKGGEPCIVLNFRHSAPSFLPLEFHRPEGLLRFFSIHPQGKGHTLTLGLNPEFNYQVAQDYFERERLYTLTVTKIP